MDNSAEGPDGARVPSKHPYSDVPVAELVAHMKKQNFGEHTLSEIVNKLKKNKDLTSDDDHKLLVLARYIASTTGIEALPKEVLAYYDGYIERSYPLKARAGVPEDLKKLCTDCSVALAELMNGKSKRRAEGPSDQ